MFLASFARHLSFVVLEQGAEAGYEVQTEISPDVSAGPLAIAKRAAMRTEKATAPLLFILAHSSASSYVSKNMSRLQG